MRIHCDIEVCNRLLPSFNIRQKGVRSKGTVSVGKKAGSKSGEIYLLVCTKQDTSGTHFKLKKNIHQCFSKFIGDGKATLRLGEPPFDLCLSKADPVQLKALLSVLKLATQGHCLDDVTLSSLAPASSSQVERMKTKLKVSSHRDYPIRDGFPSSLELLTVTGCSLKRIDSRILRLRCLRVLDLSDNNLISLPEDWNAMDCLTELRIQDNRIEQLPKDLCCGAVGLRLCVLNLSNNNIKFLQPYFCSMTKLSSLKLDFNRLQTLPQRIGVFQQLRTFSIAHNQLKTLPASFTELRLESLDLFGNSFVNDGPASAINKLGFPSLMELTARAITTHKVPYTEEDVGVLFPLLQAPKHCLCGGPCFQSYVYYLASIDLHHVTAGLTAVDESGRTSAPTDAFLCSDACFERYKRNPNATIWK